jgi:uncharacterized iron-regulated membrane protein
VIQELAWAQWATWLAPTVTVEAVIAWLDAAQPDPELDAERIRHVLAAITEAARAPGCPSACSPRRQSGQVVRRTPRQACVCAWLATLRAALATPRPGDQS